ncbi:hypothetical protein [Methanobrevibacter sp.]|uniref:hypothetical protein n=1 Tax=Methanobrevibacter sp. TaxID=66852 RepID=UPI0038662AD8
MNLWKPYSQSLTLNVHYTYQSKDYSKYENYIFSEEEKRQYHEEFSRRTWIID